MHKLAKGLKKKKKSKKGKKGAEEDEFDREELERYRRERAEAQAKASGSGPVSGSSEGAENSKEPNSSLGGSDEWQKFQALTAGVDSILKKTQGDLDRIKSTSFFQRKVPVDDQQLKEQKEAQAVAQQAKRNQEKRWIGFDSEGNPIEKENTEVDNDNDQTKAPIGEIGFVDVPDDDEDEEDSAEEDIFDTTYVDVLQNIDVQLAYIPESPTQEGDDPFDTSNADKVLKTVDKKGNRLVSLGNAVEVLSGRVDHVSTCKLTKPRKNQIQDLLLDDNVDDLETTGSESFVVEKTLLDDDTDLPDVPIDINIPIAKPIINGNNDVNPNLDISEFELIGKEKTILEAIPDLDDAEFDLDNHQPILDTEDPFETKTIDNRDNYLESVIVEASFEAASFVNEEDPFDTTFADNILPGKTELKFIEKELEEVPTEVSISLTDPSGLKRDYETGLLSSDPSSAANIAAAKQDIDEDLLAGSTSDLDQLNDQPIQPAEEITYVDPFDTSAVEELPPGRTELKFLEREFLGDDVGRNSGTCELEDDDFDPRKEETKITPTRPSQPNFRDFQDQDIGQSRDLSGRKPSRPEVLGLPSKTVNFDLPTPSQRPDLLQTSEEEKSSASTKPLTPYYSQKSLDEVLPEDGAAINVDPFDTSFVGKVAPGKTELKLIESELLARQEPSKLKHSTSEQDLETAGSLEASSDSERSRRRRSDFGPRNIRVFNPEVDPSLIEEPERPWQGHRASLQSNGRQESILDAEVEVDAKPLTPKVETKNRVDEITYVDPFDTSIATNILPGKAELKLLENELRDVPEIPVRINTELDRILAKDVTPDDEFDPRAGEGHSFAESEETTTDFLSLEVHQDPGKVLTPLHEEALEVVDPFDTSFASLGPGKTELKLLESELMEK